MMVHRKLALALADGELRQGTVDALDFLLTPVRYMPSRSFHRVGLHPSIWYLCFGKAE